jgi:hypothetical protein
VVAVLPRALPPTVLHGGGRRRRRARVLLTL